MNIFVHQYFPKFWDLSLGLMMRDRSAGSEGHLQVGHSCGPCPPKLPACLLIRGRPEDYGLYEISPAPRGQRVWRCRDLRLAFGKVGRSSLCFAFLGSPCSCSGLVLHIMVAGTFLFLLREALCI